MMADRQATIDEHNRYQAHSLDQIRGRLDRVRNEQQAQLAQFARKDKEKDYIAEAKYAVDQENAVRLLIEPQDGPTFEVPASKTIQWEKPDVIEIDPHEDECEGEVAHHDD